MADTVHHTNADHPLATIIDMLITLHSEGPVQITAMQDSPDWSFGKDA
jgi:hypothetical protein